MATSTVTITLQGKSGTRYEFEIYLWGTPFKAVGGVYSVLCKDPGGYAVIYIGQTGDLSDRFKGHHQQVCFDSHRKSHLGVHQESSEDRRLAIEADLVANYNPPCNG